MSNLIKKIKYLVGNKIVQATIALCLSMTLFVSVCFAWFVTLDNVNSNIFAVDNSAPQVLKVSDTIYLTRVLGSSIKNFAYIKSADGLYLRDDNENGVLDDEETTPIALTGLMPKEYLDFTINVSAFKNIDDYSFITGFKNMWGGTFENPNNIEEIYSILGVYKLNFYDSTLLNGQPVYTLNTDYNYWFDNYSETNLQNKYEAYKSYSPSLVSASGNPTSENNPLSLLFNYGNWGEIDNKDGVKDNNITLKFRLTIDLKQYNSLNFDKRNALSEAEISIGSVFINVK